MHPLQPADRGLRREARGRDPRRRQGLREPEGPDGAPRRRSPAAECHTSDEESPCCAKHVVLRTDRSDGFVGRNFLMRGAREHGFYTEETDGILLDRVKFFWNADYGHLSFTTDHNVIQNCDGFGSGDAVVYPGAVAADRRVPQRELLPRAALQHGRPPLRPARVRHGLLRLDGQLRAGDEQPLLRQRERPHDGHALGGRAPRLPRGRHEDRQQLVLREQPRRLPATTARSRPLVPQPVGTGFFWAGNNDGNFSNNWVFDNWRQGTMLIAIPDAVAGTPEGEADPQTQCPTSGTGLATRPRAATSTSETTWARCRPASSRTPALDVVRQPDDARRRHARPPRTASTSGGTRPREHRQLLVRQRGVGRHARESHRRTRRSAPRGPVDARVPAGGLRDEHGQRARLLGARRRSFSPATGSGRRATWTRRSCSWWDTPPQARSAAAASQRRAEDRLEPSQSAARLGRCPRRRHLVRPARLTCGRRRSAGPRCSC